MYNILFWKDHAVNPNNTYTVKENADGTITLTPAGEVLQQGTNMSATNFNNMELGIFDSDLAARILLLSARDNADRLTITEDAIIRVMDEFATEEKSVMLTNSSSYPFNNSVDTVSLSVKRKTINYTVDYEIVAFDGNVGEVVISDKQLNGFKLAYTGSAKSVTIKLKIRGGIIS